MPLRRPRLAAGSCPAMESPQGRKGGPASCHRPATGPVVGSWWRLFRLADYVVEPVSGPARPRWKRKVRNVGQGQGRTLVEGNQKSKAVLGEVAVEGLFEVPRQQFGGPTLHNHVVVASDNRPRHSQKTATWRATLMGAGRKPGCRTCIKPAGGLPGEEGGAEEPSRVRSRSRRRRRATQSEPNPSVSARANAKILISKLISDNGSVLLFRLRSIKR